MSFSFSSKSIDSFLTVKIFLFAGVTVNNESTDLDENGKDDFHSVVAKLLYITKRARPDIETALALLCTRVSRSTTEDWKKIAKSTRFLKKHN